MIYHSTDVLRPLGRSGSEAEEGAMITVFRPNGARFDLDDAHIRLTYSGAQFAHVSPALPWYRQTLRSLWLWTNPIVPVPAWLSVRR